VDKHAKLTYDARALKPPTHRVNFSVSNKDGRLAQLVEQMTLNHRVAGSNPASPTILTEARAADGQLTIEKLL
jgi:hypothetical protein